VSTLIAVADAVVADLNAAAFSQAFTAVRYYRPVFDLAAMDALHVSVVPKAMTSEVLSRSRTQDEYQVDVAVQRKVAAEADLDPLLALVEEIADHVRFKRLTLAGGGEAVWMRTENQPVYAPEHLDELRQFTSVLTLAFLVGR